MTVSLRSRTGVSSCCPTCPDSAGPCGSRASITWLSSTCASRRRSFASCASKSPHASPDHTDAMPVRHLRDEPVQLHPFARVARPTLRRAANLSVSRTTAGRPAHRSDHACSGISPSTSTRTRGSSRQRISRANASAARASHRAARLIAQRDADDCARLAARHHVRTLRRAVRLGRVRALLVLA